MVPFSQIQLMVVQLHFSDFFVFNLTKKLRMFAVSFLRLPRLSPQLDFVLFSVFLEIFLVYDFIVKWVKSVMIEIWPE